MAGDTIRQALLEIAGILTELLTDDDALRVQSGGIVAAGAVLGVPGDLQPLSITTLGRLRVEDPEPAPTWETATPWRGAAPWK